MSIGTSIVNAAQAAGSWIAHHPVQSVIIGGGLVAAGVLASGCVAEVAPPVGANPEESNLINRLNTNTWRFNNQQQHQVIGDIRGNGWNANEAGNMLTTVANHIGTYNAIDSWRMTKYNNRDTREITGLVQALDGTTRLSDDQVRRVVVDVLSTDYPVQQTMDYFREAELNPWTTNHDDIKYFEEFLGLRYPSWHYPGETIWVDPFPDYYPDPSYPTDYWPKPKLPVSDGDDPVYFPDDPGYPSDPSSGDDPINKQPWDDGGGSWDNGAGDDPVSTPWDGGSSDPSYPGDDSSEFGSPDKFE